MRLELHISPSWGIFLIYKKLVAKSPSFLRKESPIFRDKYVFPYLGLIFHYQGLIIPYQRLFLRKVRDLETRKFADKYPLLFPAFIYLSITNLPYTERWPIGGT